VGSVGEQKDGTTRRERNLRKGPTDGWQRRATSKGRGSKEFGRTGQNGAGKKGGKNPKRRGAIPGEGAAPSEGKKVKR